MITLGLDLGPSSLGWALVDREKGKLIDMGVRIFPEGVNREKGTKEQPKNATRRDARQIRKQYFRKRLRKKILLDRLIELEMTPFSPDDVQHWWQTGSTPNKKEINEWFSLNPYQLRSEALERKLTPHEIGRIFYHLAQRRGFKSNRKTGSSEDTVIFTGKIKEERKGIQQTREEMADYKTLGAFLNDLHPKPGAPYRERERIRKRYTTRSMYIDEFEKIWDAQQAYHPSLLNFENRQYIGGRKNEETPNGDVYTADGVLFFQRPLRSQKHLVGKCTFEPSKPRAPISCIEFEEFRAWQTINSIEYRGEKLDVEQKHELFKLFMSKDRVSFSQIKTKLGYSKEEEGFNYQNDDKFSGSTTVAKLSSKDFFGKEWYAFSDKQKEDIWHNLFFAEDPEWLKELAITKWGFDESKAEKIAKLELKQGYAALSRKAIRNILPYLSQGYLYHNAVILGGIRNTLGSNWEETYPKIFDGVFEIIWGEEQPERAVTRIRELLRSELKLSDKKLCKLYHHSTAVTAEQTLDNLPVTPEADREINNIRNPMVIQALFEVRRVVNAIIEEYGKPDEIRVELGRDLKKGKQERERIQQEQRDREQENQKIVKTLEEHGISPSRDAILRYRLWEECNRICPYTGDEIGFKELYSGEFEIEHIIPWSRSLNNSFTNLTLCRKDVNNDKGNKTPYEYFQQRADYEWEQVKERAKKLFANRASYGKFRMFTQKGPDDDFISRQLNDMRYMSRETGAYLKKICDQVRVSPGMLTSELRYAWGLNTILSDGTVKNEKSMQKERVDHRHHAIDAVTIACAEESHLKQLATWNKFNRDQNMEPVDLPWPTFRKDVEQAISEILVSYKKIRRLLTVRSHKTRKKGKDYKNIGIAARGGLHKESVFGRRKQADGDYYHLRKPITDIDSMTKVQKIANPGLQKHVLNFLIDEGYDVNRKSKIKPETFIQYNEDNVPEYRLKLPNRNGEPVPVKRIRLKEVMSGAVRLKSINQYVNPRNNHHILIYEDLEGKPAEEVVTFWEAVQRKKQGVPVFKIPEDATKMLYKLQENDLFLLGLPDEKIEHVHDLEREEIARHLYRVQKISKEDYNFRKHTESTLTRDEVPYFFRFQSFKALFKENPIPVILTELGRVKFYDPDTIHNTAL